MPTVQVTDDEQILDGVWQNTVGSGTSQVDTHVGCLRSKLEGLIRTVHGFGCLAGAA
ncbi:helix-turn-helix domain-containing protein [Kutzneria buriramensis]|uniref:helix-turn-helix domain-containing protein n=1 Tax=Kutzneria buriramensis TaxID=1045776 RepID=UPI0024825591|nr:helix-turn-helix domain-containing protein [Kutzneria buriramensis]